MDRYIRIVFKFICASCLTLFALWLIVGVVFIVYALFS